MHSIAGGIHDHMMTFNLREYDSFDRVDLIRKAIERFHENLWICND